MSEYNRTAHIPSVYIGGVYIKQTDVWLGDFSASQDELMNYSEYGVKTIQEFDIVITMAIAQYEYEAWWNRIRRK